MLANATQMLDEGGEDGMAGDLTSNTLAIVNGEIERLIAFEETESGESLDREDLEVFKDSYVSFIREAKNKGQYVDPEKTLPQALYFVSNEFNHVVLEEIILEDDCEGKALKGLLDGENSERIWRQINEIVKSASVYDDGEMEISLRLLGNSRGLGG